MTMLQNDFDRERIPVRRLAWYENVKPSDSEGVWWEALIDFSDTYTVKKGSFLKLFVQHHH